MVEIRSKSLYVIESGMAMTVDDDAGLELHFNLENRLDFTVVIEFEEREERKEEVKVTTSVESESSRIKMVFSYSMAPASFGLREPMEIAKIDGETIFIRVWVTPLGTAKKTKKVDFVLYKTQGVNE